MQLARRLLRSAGARTKDGNAGIESAGAAATKNVAGFCRPGGALQKKLASARMLENPFGDELAACAQGRVV
jgi:hypothetical protein